MLAAGIAMRSQEALQGVTNMAANANVVST
jgi:hypothetical protein